MHAQLFALFALHCESGMICLLYLAGSTDAYFAVAIAMCCECARVDCVLGSGVLLRDEARDAYSGVCLVSPFSKKATRDYTDARAWRRHESHPRLHGRVGLLKGGAPVVLFER